MHTDARNLFVVDTEAQLAKLAHPIRPASIPNGVRLVPPPMYKATGPHRRSVC